MPRGGFRATPAAQKNFHFFLAIPKRFAILSPIEGNQSDEQPKKTMSTTSANEVMVELYPGYGDGFGIVRLDESGTPEINPARKVTHWKADDGTKIKMDAATSAILSRSSVSLIDGHVRVDTGAIKRVIGPIDCPEAIRVRAKRYTTNWGDSGFVFKATDAQLAAAMTLPTEPEVYAAMSALRASINE